MVDFAQGLVGDVEIDTRGGDACMTEQTLNGDQIGTTFKQSCGKVVTQNVWSELPFWQIGFDSQLVHETLNAAWLQAPARLIEQKRFGFISQSRRANGQIRIDAVLGAFRKQNDAIFVPFSSEDFGMKSFDFNVGKVEVAQLGNAHTRIEQDGNDHGCNGIFRGVCGLNDRGKLSSREGARQLPTGACPYQVIRPSVAKPLDHVTGSGKPCVVGGRTQIAHRMGPSIDAAAQRFEPLCERGDIHRFKLGFAENVFS